VETYKQEFIEFMVASGVLLFGDFTTKSGRKTPFFINTGKYETGDQMRRLGRFYAQALTAAVHEPVAFLFGPAYKGIPLAVATAIGMADLYKKDIAVCFNRKEAKDHGEGGSLIGHKPADGERLVIVEDVTTAGTSIRESIELLSAVAKVVFGAVIVSVDRMEKGQHGDKSAIQEIRDEFGIPVHPIVTLDEIVRHLHNRAVDGRMVLDDRIKSMIDEYRKLYGAKERGATA
jgi:orotate phosphoribosyltransferase